ncbi:MAG TPA: glycosyltransferase family 39 protein [Alphaproteobacteria bacterium]
MVALAAALRWHQIAAMPLWLDEVISWHRAQLPFEALVADSLANMHLPTYFLLLGGVTSVFGDSELALRMPSLVFGVLSVLIAFFAGRAALGPAAGLVAAVLMALSPFQVMYGQEARAYTAATLMLTIALWGLIELATDAEATRDRGDGPFRPRPRGWALWAGGTAAALLLMSVAVPWLIASAVVFAVIRTRTPSARRRAFDRALLAAVLPVLALWLPWLPALAGATANSVAHFWASPLSPASLASGIWAVYLFGVIDPVGFERIADLAPWRACLIAAAAVAGCVALRRRPVVLVALLAASAAPILTLGAASAFAPVFAPRYLAAGAPAFLVLAATGAVYAASKIARPALVTAGALTLVADLGINLAGYYAAETKPRWDLAAAALADWLHEDDAVLFQDGFTRWLVSIHLARAGRSVPPDLFVVAPEELARARANRPIGRVWVPYGRVGFGAAPTEADIVKWLGEGLEPTQIEAFGRSVRLARFDLSPPQGGTPPPPDTAGPALDAP